MERVAATSLRAILLPPRLCCEAFDGGVVTCLGRARIDQALRLHGFEEAFGGNRPGLVEEIRGAHARTRAVVLQWPRW